MIDSLMVFRVWKKDLIIIPAVMEDLLRIAWKCMKIAPIIYAITWDQMKSLYLSFSNFPKKTKQKPIRNSCRSNSWSTPILILWNIEFKILTKEPGDEALLVSFKFPMREWDQRLVDFNRCSSIETQSCYSCLPLLLYLHGYYYTSMVKQMLKVLVDWRR